MLTIRAFNLKVERVRYVNSSVVMQSIGVVHWGTEMGVFPYVYRHYTVELGPAGELLWRDGGRIVARWARVR